MVPETTSSIGRTTIRRYRPTDDAASLHALLDAARLRGELPDLTEREVPLWVEFSAALADMMAVAVDEHGAMLGIVSPEPKLVIVAPEHRRRGVGTALVAEGLAIERERGRPNLLMGPVAGDAGTEAFLRRLSFAYHSSVWRLDLAGDAGVPAPSFPEGVVARSFEAGDEAAYVDVFNAAFADHPTPLVLTEDIAAFITGHPEFTPADFVVLSRVEEPGRFIGFCETHAIRETADGPMVEGEVDLIGVRPEWQGQGLGRELLRWGVARLRSLGVRAVFLTVNVTNERALGLYERHGFQKTREKPRWALRVGEAA